MKPIKHLVCMAGVAGGLLAATAGLAAAEPATTNTPATPAQPAQPADAPTQPADNATQAPQPPADNSAAPQATAPAAATPAVVPQPVTPPVADVQPITDAEFAAGKGLRMNFRDVPLEMVLNYLSKAAGFAINVTRSVDVHGRVNVWSEQPLSKVEAVELLEKVLNQNGYTVIQDKRILTIISTDKAKINEDTKVVRVDDFNTFPKDNKVVTAVVPVHSLNPVQLLKDLKDVLPPDTSAVANESSNSILITDTRANIRRIADIIATLDSVSSGVNTLQVFSLKNADAKSVSDMIKELFPSQDSNNRGGGGFFGTRFGGRGGGRGGFFGGFPGMGGPGGDSGGDGSTGQTPTQHITAVADDHSNSVIVSAPEGLMSVIKSVIDEIDVNVQAITTSKVFKLKHADSIETADLINSLYQDESTSSDAARQNQGGGFQGGGFTRLMMAMNGGGRNSTANSQSARMQLMGRVNAVPDPRTGFLVVTAARDLMPSIENIVNQLDESTAKIVRPHVISLNNANPYEMLTALTDVIAPNPTIKSTSTTTASTKDFEGNRAQTISTSQNQNQASVGTSFGGGNTGR